MRARIVAPGKLLLDEAGAMYLNGKGYGAVRLEGVWKKYPWATHALHLAGTDRVDRAQSLSRMVRDYSNFVDAT